MFSPDSLRDFSLKEKPDPNGISYKNCDTCRKALRWLEENHLRHEVVPIREQPPTEAEVRRMLGFYDLRKLFNTSGQDYKALNLKDKLPRMSQAEAIRLLSQNGNLVRRPFALSERAGWSVSTRRNGKRSFKKI